MSTPDLVPITLRPAAEDDIAALWRLAALDSAALPRGPLVVAEVDGELRVALSADGRAVIADPFHRTAELIALMRDHLARSAPADTRPPRSARARRVALLAAR